MRLRGFTMREISERSATECPIGRHMAISTVHKRINAELAARPQATANQLRELELSKLDEQERKIRAVQDREHWLIQAGEVVRDAKTGSPIVDDKAVLQAADRLARIGERRAKLLGIEAPQQIVTDATIRYEIVGVNPDDLR